MRHFGVGTKVFCDFTFGGKPEGKVVAVIKPGDGNRNAGEVLVQLTETVGAYRKGERLAISTYQAVPMVMERPLNRGEYFRRISTLYAYTGTGDCGAAARQ